MGHECVSKHIGEKLNVLKLMGDESKHLHSHDALVLLHHSFAIPKMMHILKTAPCFSSSSLEDMMHFFV